MSTPPIHPMTLALQWAARGVPAFPCAISLRPDGSAKLDKVPMTAHGHRDASIDPDVVRDMFVQAEMSIRAGAELAVGLLPGAAGYIVLDPDVKDGQDGPGFADSLGIPPGWLVATASGGGQHRWFAKPDPDARYSNATPDDWHGLIDIRADNGWVVAPGTVTTWGSWSANVPWPDDGPPEAPQVVLDALTPAGDAGGVAEAHRAGALTEERRAMLPEHTLRVFDWLAEHHGAHDPQVMEREGDVPYLHVCRPGKARGVSATIGFASPGSLFVFSSSWPGLPVNESVYPLGRDTDMLGAEAPAAPTRPEPVPIVTLAEAHTVFRKWLGPEYDLDALNVVLAAAAVERLDGDPLWVLVVSGSGNAKTETVQAVSDGAVMVSTISSIGALLSGTSKRERSKDASGGLLRQLEPRGLLIIKDVTSILSMSRDARAEVLGALREVHDGSWDRLVGTDGGRTLSWSGRIGVIGAVTTAWDAAHAVIASMGDRFAIVRIDSSEATGRAAGGRQAMANIGSEDTMRAELRAAAAGVLAGMATEGIKVTPEEVDLIFEAANLVTMARTGVEYAYNGDVIDAHAPEAPTRFAKELVQVVRGAVAVGMDRDAALSLAIRVARDSMPPLRLAIIDDLAEHPGSTTYAVRKRIGKPRATVDRQLQALHMLGVVVVDEEPAPQVGGFGGGSKWAYSLADWVDPATLRQRSPHGPDMATPVGSESSSGAPESAISQGARGIQPNLGRVQESEQRALDVLADLIAKPAKEAP